LISVAKPNFMAVACVAHNTVYSQRSFALRLGWAFKTSIHPKKRRRSTVTTIEIIKIVILTLLALLALSLVAGLVAWLRIRSAGRSGADHHAGHDHETGDFHLDQVATQLFVIILMGAGLNFVFTWGITATGETCEPYMWDRFIHTWGFWTCLGLYFLTHIFVSPWKLRALWKAPFQFIGGIIGTAATIGCMVLGICSLLYWYDGYHNKLPFWDNQVMHQLFPVEFAEATWPAEPHSYDCSGYTTRQIATPPPPTPPPAPSVKKVGRSGP
jgi:hypothetical protein